MLYNTRRRIGSWCCRGWSQVCRLCSLGVKHFLGPKPFRTMLIASGLPMVDLNLIAAPPIYTALTLKRLDPAHLPVGLTQVPLAPPLPLPIVILVGALVVVMLGGGAWSVDAAMRGKSRKRSGTAVPGV